MTSGRETKDAREKAARLRAEAASREARRRGVLITLGVLAAIVVLVGVGVVIKLAQHDKEVREAVTTPAGVTDSSFVVGKADAPATLRVYEDFLCPACAQFEKLNRDQLDKLVEDGKLRIEYRPVSILDRLSTDEYPTRAANASAAVWDSSPSSWPAFHEALIDNQPAENGPGLPDDKLVELATAAGATDPKVKAAVEAGTFEGWVKKVSDQASSGTDKLTGTPTLIVFPTDDPSASTKLKNYSVDTVANAIAEASK